MTRSSLQDSKERGKGKILQMIKTIQVVGVFLVFWITDECLTSRPEMGAPSGPGWAAQAAFSGQSWLHQYCDEKPQEKVSTCILCDTNTQNR